MSSINQASISELSAPGPGGTAVASWRRPIGSDPAGSREAGSQGHGIHSVTTSSPYDPARIDRRNLLVRPVILPPGAIAARPDGGPEGRAGSVRRRSLYDRVGHRIGLY